MSINDKKQALSQGGTKPKIEKPAPPPPKVEKKDTSIFGGEKSIPMKDAKWKIMKGSSVIPETGGKMYSPKEKMEMMKKWDKFGYVLEKDKDVPRFFKDRYKEKGKAKTGDEKRKIEREINFWKGNLFGK